MVKDKYRPPPNLYWQCFYKRNKTGLQQIRFTVVLYISSKSVVLLTLKLRRSSLTPPAAKMPYKAAG